MIHCLIAIFYKYQGYHKNRSYWYQEPIPFIEAAEIGTEKVIKDHSTIGIVITTDGSIGDIPRNSYEEAENFAKNNYLIYCETSSKDGINVEDAFETLTKNIIDKEVLNNSKVMSLSSVKAVKGKMKNEFGCC